MDTGFCDLDQRHIQVIHTFLGSLRYSNLDDIPLKISSFHSSQMLFQPFVTLIRWDLPQNSVLPQLLRSPQHHQSSSLSLLSGWRQEGKPSLLLRPVFHLFHSAAPILWLSQRPCIIKLWAMYT